MITIKEEDLFTAPNGVICHQVNCQGAMGHGIAKTFKEKYPEAFKEYKQQCDTSTSEQLLGTILFRQESDGMYTCCMFAQDDWRGENVCNTSYEAFRSCCKEIKDCLYNFNMRDLPINMPYYIGAGLGGGEWTIIYSILKEELGDCNLILWRVM